MFWIRLSILELEKRYRKLIADDEKPPPPPSPNSPTLPKPPPSPPGPPLTLPAEDNNNDLDRPERERYFPFSTRTPGSDHYDDDYDSFPSQAEETEQINLDENLLEIFPGADKILDEKTEDDPDEIAAYKEISSALEKIKLPRGLDFFTGDENENFKKATFFRSEQE